MQNLDEVFLQSIFMDLWSAVRLYWSSIIRALNRISFVVRTDYLYFVHHQRCFLLWRCRPYNLLFFVCPNGYSSMLFDLICCTDIRQPIVRSTSVHSALIVCLWIAAKPKTSCWHKCHRITYAEGRTCVDAARALTPAFEIPSLKVYKNDQKRENHEREAKKILCEAKSPSHD